MLSTHGSSVELLIFIYKSLIGDILYIYSVLTEGEHGLPVEYIIKYY